MKTKRAYLSADMARKLGTLIRMYRERHMENESPRIERAIVRLKNSLTYKMTKGALI